jgi:hypothetical protein
MGRCAEKNSGMLQLGNKAVIEQKGKLQFHESLTAEEAGVLGMELSLLSIENPSRLRIHLESQLEDDARAQGYCIIMTGNVVFAVIKRVTPPKTNSRNRECP